MEHNNKEPGPGIFFLAANTARAVGAALIGLSLLRWPATALLVSPAWELLDGRWAVILAVQTGAEAMFWIGVWLVGRQPLRQALARVSETRPVCAILARTSRLARSVQSRSGGHAPGAV